MKASGSRSETFYPVPTTRFRVVIADEFDRSGDLTSRVFVQQLLLTWNDVDHSRSMGFGSRGPAEVYAKDTWRFIAERELRGAQTELENAQRSVKTLSEVLAAFAEPASGAT